MVNWFIRLFFYNQLVIFFQSMPTISPSSRCDRLPKTVNLQGDDGIEETRDTQFHWVNTKNQMEVITQLFDCIIITVKTRIRIIWAIEQWCALVGYQCFAKHFITWFNRILSSLLLESLLKGETASIDDSNRRIVHSLISKYSCDKKKIYNHESFTTIEVCLVSCPPAVGNFLLVPVNKDRTMDTL